MRKGKYKEIKHFTAKFLITLSGSIALASIPLIVFGGEALMFSVAVMQALDDLIAK